YKCEKCDEIKTESIPALESGESEPSDPSEPSTPEKPFWQNLLEKIFGDWWGDEEEECEHEYTSVITEPTCEEQGYTTFTCKKCGYSYKDEYTDALGHQYEDGKCIRCNKKEPVEPDTPDTPGLKDIWEWLISFFK
ncbi:MAG: hypothetical protein ACI3XM_00955, partial [Eubacteriales bacterium]